MKQKSKKTRYNKKAFSPLLATILLIGFTILLAALVFTWSGRFITTTEEVIGTMIQSSEDLGIEIEDVAYDSYGTLSLTVENKQNNLIDNLTVILTGEEGTQAIIISGLNQYETNRFTIFFNPLITGINLTKIEVIPVTIQDKKYLLHSLSKETKVITEINITIKDADNDACIDIFDYYQESYCPKDACLDQTTKCNELCQPQQCSGTRESCGCDLGSCITCSPNQECINNTCREQCVLTDAYWSESIVNTNTPVNLTVKGINCDNKTINLIYEEIDALTANDIIEPLHYNLPLTLTFIGDIASASWNPIYFEDADSLDDQTKLRFTAIGSFIQSDVLTLMSNPPSETPLLEPCPAETGSSWTIPSGTIVDCIGKQVIVNGDVDIFGMLSIQESSLSIIVPDAVISVKSPMSEAQDGGTLIIKNSNITPLGTLTALLSTEPNTRLEIHNSNLSNLGSFYDGLTINSDNTFINNTVFTNIETIAIDGRNHIFLNNTVIGNEHTPYLIAFGWMDSSHNNTILNNTIRNVKGADAGDVDAALSVYGDNNTINFNKITGVVGSDTLSGGGRTLLEGAYPLTVGGSNNQIEQNNITENWAEADTPALLVVGHNNTMLLNEIKDNRKNMDGLRLGISWWETLENNTIINNIIINNPGEGIQLINAVNTTIISNFLDSNLDNGDIYLLQSNGTLLLNNRIEGMTIGITIENSNKNLFENNFINLTPRGFSSVGNKYGILFKGSSAENLFVNTTIITWTSQSHGIYFNGTEVKNNRVLRTTISPGGSSAGILFAGNIHNNTVENIKIKAEGALYSYNGITFAGSTVQGNVIKNGDIWSRGASSQALFFQNNAKENKIIDATLTSLLNSKTIRVKDGAGKNYLLNVTYDDDQVLFQGTATAYDLYRQWYLNVTVVDEIIDEPIQGANVTSFNITAAETENLNENFVFSDLTDITGMITIQNITEYIQNQLTKIFLNNYTFNTTEYLPDLDIYEENITSYNITNNSDILIKLTPKTTALSLGMSETLTNGIAWDITSIPIIEQSATGNNDATTQITEYMLILESQSSTPVIISIKADNDLFNGIETIPIINEKFAYSLIDVRIPSPLKTSLSTSYQTITPLTLEAGIPQTVYLKFYLDVPPSKAPGSYANNILFKLEPA